MKILLPYNCTLGKGFNDPRVVGGIEKFCHSIHQSFDDVIVLDINEPKDFNKSTELIKKTALEHDVDIVIGFKHHLLVQKLLIFLFLCL